MVCLQEYVQVQENTALRTDKENKPAMDGSPISPWNLKQKKTHESLTTE
ncbi:hypothetical protein OIU78_026620 [Salix suchowensis]|nr:hypothetical protein OIU78_026620 [Salix suchowensis]